MTNKLSDAITKFYHDLSISELQIQNSLQGQTKLTYNDILYIDIIRAYPGKYTSSKIADILCVSRPSVTKKIKELIKKGYLIRKQCEKDKRVYYLFVNEDNSFNFYEEKFEEILLEKFNEKYSKKEIDVLCEAISLIGDMMIEVNNMGDI